MSTYGELVQLVSGISEETFQCAEMLVALSNQAKERAALFARLTATTGDRSADEVKASFNEANRQILIAARALMEAGKTGSEWCGNAQPQLTLRWR